jgi:hypothetical protein
VFYLPHPWLCPLLYHCKPWLNSILCCTCTIGSSMSSSFLLHPCPFSPLTLVIFMTLPRCWLWTYPLKPPLFQPSLRVVCYLSLPWLLSPLVALQVLSQPHPLSCFYLLLHLTFIISQYLPSCLSCTCILNLLSPISVRGCGFAYLVLGCFPFVATSQMLLQLYPLLCSCSCCSPRLSTTLESSCSLF